MKIKYNIENLDCPNCAKKIEDKLNSMEEFNNVSSSIFVCVPSGCCMTASVRNISAQAIEVQNANLIIERVA